MITEINDSNLNPIVLEVSRQGSRIVEVHLADPISVVLAIHNKGTWSEMVCWIYDDGLHNGVYGAGAHWSFASRVSEIVGKSEPNFDRTIWSLDALSGAWTTTHEKLDIPVTIGPPNISPWGGKKDWNPRYVGDAMVAWELVSGPYYFVIKVGVA